MSLYDAIAWALLVLMIELWLDPIFWKKNLNEKKLSNFIRITLTILVSSLTYLVHGVNPLAMAALIIGAYALFDPLINIYLDMPINYHPRRPGWDGWWHKRNDLQWVVLRMVWMATSIATFLILR